jgi:hypothetical protein
VNEVESRAIFELNRNTTKFIASNESQSLELISTNNNDLGMRQSTVLAPER